MKKIIMVLLIFSGLKLYTISTTINHRLVTSSPLLYKQIDYSYENLSIEFEPWVSGMFDPDHAMDNLTPNGSITLSLNQQGQGDINSAWLCLGSSNRYFNYESKVTFTPQEQMYGLLFHTYKQFEFLFFDIRTALLQCKTKVDLFEDGGGNGGIDTNMVDFFAHEGRIGTNTGMIIHDAYEAFTQNDYAFGKIGKSNQMIGFDNIQVMLGGSTEFSHTDTQSIFAGFAIVEVPTGAGTKSEWLFEPQVGTNHWAIGLGFDTMFINENGFSFVFGANFRHMIANWETRTFDLTNNGAWSRYLLVTPLATVDDLDITVGFPGVNFFTQDALIEGRNQFNIYARLEKRFEKALFEFSYNFFYNEAELIRQVTSIPSGYGIFAAGSGGGLSTASDAHINQAYNADIITYPYYYGLDFSPVELVTSDLNLSSGAATKWISSMIAARLQRVQDHYTYGIGASLELAQSVQAFSSWSVWANFEILLS